MKIILYIICYIIYKGVKPLEICTLVLTNILESKLV